MWTLGVNGKSIPSNQCHFKKSHRLTPNVHFESVAKRMPYSKKTHYYPLSLLYINQLLWIPALTEWLAIGEWRRRSEDNLLEWKDCTVKCGIFPGNTRSHQTKCETKIVFVWSVVVHQFWQLGLVYGLEIFLAHIISVRRVSGWSSCTLVFYNHLMLVLLFVCFVISESEKNALVHAGDDGADLCDAEWCTLL